MGGNVVDKLPPAANIGDIASHRWRWQAGASLNEIGHFEAATKIERGSAARIQDDVG